MVLCGFPTWQVPLGACPSQGFLLTPPVEAALSFSQWRPAGLQHKFRQVCWAVEGSSLAQQANSQLCWSRAEPLQQVPSQHCSQGLQRHVSPSAIGRGLGTRRESRACSLHPPDAHFPAPFPQREAPFLPKRTLDSPGDSKMRLSLP